MDSTRCFLLCLLLSGSAGIVAGEQESWVFRDGFEGGLSHWQLGAKDKHPLKLVTDRAFSGKHSAYSGPPGTMRAMKTTFPFPLTGRVEIRFYDDLASSKQQLVGVGGEHGELLAVICPGGAFYQTRVGRTYADTPVRRTRGWRLFSFVCDGARTTAAIDGRVVYTDSTLHRIHSLLLGSFWDASTGWFDDVRVSSSPPAVAGAWVEAEHPVFVTDLLKRNIHVRKQPGCSGLAVANWNAVGQRLGYPFDARHTSGAKVLLRYSTPGDKPAALLLTSGDASHRLSLPPTGGDGKWGFAACSLRIPEGVSTLTLELVRGAVNLDWLAVMPAGAEPEPYGEAVTAWLEDVPFFRKVRRRLQPLAKSPGAASVWQLTDLETLHELPSTAQWKAASETLKQALSQAVASFVDARRSRLRAEFFVPTSARLGPETPLSRECYRRLLRYVRLTAPRFHDWPYLPASRYHKRDGHQEWDVRQNATVALGYAVLLKGPFDPAAAGVSRAQLQRDLAGLLRYLAVTHRANVLPTGDGEPWGDQWQSAFWAGIAGQAAWTVWETLPEDTRLLVARMVAHEADRFLNRPPDSGEWHDTKAEENAWNSEVIALAACMFPRHPHHEQWTERAIVYMINSFTTKADLTSTQVVDGRPVRDRVTAVTIHPDFTLENHNRVHPDYLATGALLLRNALLYRFAGLPCPESTFYHVPETWRVLKRLIAANGSCFYINGQDWWPHRHDVPLLLAALMSVLKHDPEAAFVERASLEFFGRMHVRFQDGRAWDPREYNYANAEEEMIARYAELYLAHRLFGEGPKPVARETFLAKQSGTFVFDIGGFALQRTPTKFVSFAWVNGAMGLVYTRDDTWFTAPYERGMVGTIRCLNLPDTRPVVTEHHVSKGPELQLTARLLRCGGKVEQRIALVSRADAPVVYVEQLRALAPVTVQEIATGCLGVLNEDAPGISPNVRVIRFAGGQTRVVGAADRPDESLRWPGPWVNIDDRFGIVGAGETLACQANHRYHRSRLQQPVYGYYARPNKAFAAGAVIVADATLFLPGASAAATAAARLTVTRKTEDRVEVSWDGDGLIVDFKRLTVEHGRGHR